MSEIIEGFEPSNKLLLCPICGETISTFKKQKGWLHAVGNVYEYGAMCNTPHCFMIPANYNSEEEVIKVVNTRKPMERIVDRLEEMKPDIECFEDEEDYLYAIKRHNNYIKTVKEVGGIE